MKRHSLYMGENPYPDASDWDHDLSTERLIDRVTQSLRAEQPNDNLIVIVHTFNAA